jgi:hypothetical protein
MSHNRFGNTAHQYATESGAAMCSQDNELWMFFFGNADDLRCRISHDKPMFERNI